MTIRPFPILHTVKDLMIKYTLLQSVVRQAELFRTVIFSGLNLKEPGGLTVNTTLNYTTRGVCQD